MADWAGGYGAGGAAQALQDLVAQQFLVRKQAEVERQARAQEAAQAAMLQQRADEHRAELGQRMTEFVSRRDADYQDRNERVTNRNQDLQRRTHEDEIRFRERAEDTLNKNAAREDDQAHDAEQGRLNRGAQERIAGIYRQPKPQAERTVRVSYTDPETGQNVEEYMTAEEARARGKFKPATKGAAGMKEKLADLFETERIARGIITKGKEMKWRGVGPLAGRISAVGNEMIGHDPEVAALHSEIGNVFSMISNERFGAALTAQELERAATFLPQKTDPAPVLEKKLNNLIQFAESKRQNMGGTAMSPEEAPAAPPAAGPAPGTRGVINGQPAVWDGRGWLPAPASKPAGAAELFSSRR